MSRYFSGGTETIIKPLRLAGVPTEIRTGYVPIHIHSITATLIFFLIFFTSHVCVILCDFVIILRFLYEEK
jgi:hypothetical protein